MPERLQETNRETLPGIPSNLVEDLQSGIPGIRLGAYLQLERFLHLPEVQKQLRLHQKTEGDEECSLFLQQLLDRLPPSAPANSVYSASPGEGAIPAHTGTGMAQTPAKADTEGPEGIEKAGPTAPPDREADLDRLLLEDIVGKPLLQVLQASKNLSSPERHLQRMRSFLVQAPARRILQVFPPLLDMDPQAGIPFLPTLLRHRSLPIRVMSVRALYRLLPSEAIRLVDEMASNPQEVLRMIAISLMMTFPFPEVSSILFRMLEEGRIPPRIMPLATELIRNNPDPAFFLKLADLFARRGSEIPDAKMLMRTVAESMSMLGIEQGTPGSILARYIQTARENLSRLTPAAVSGEEGYFGQSDIAGAGAPETAHSPEYSPNQISPLSPLPVGKSPEAATSQERPAPPPVQTVPGPSKAEKLEPPPVSPTLGAGPQPPEKERVSPTPPASGAGHEPGPSQDRKASPASQEAGLSDADLCDAVSRRIPFPTLAGRIPQSPGAAHLRALAAAQNLSSTDPDFLKWLSRGLEQPDPGVIVLSMELLSRLGPRQLLPHLSVLCFHAHPLVMNQSIRHWRRINPQGFAQSLRRWITQPPNPRAPEAALTGLAQLPFSQARPLILLGLKTFPDSATCEKFGLLLLMNPEAESILALEEMSRDVSKTRSDQLSGIAQRCREALGMTRKDDGKGVMGPLMRFLPKDQIELLMAQISRIHFAPTASITERMAWIRQRPSLIAAGALAVLALFYFFVLSDPFQFLSVSGRPGGGNSGRSSPPVPPRDFAPLDGSLRSGVVIGCDEKNSFWVVKTQDKRVVQVSVPKEAPAALNGKYRFKLQATGKFVKGRPVYSATSWEKAE